MYFLRYACFANAHIRQVCSALQNFASLENPLIIRFFVGGRFLTFSCTYAVTPC